MPSNDTENIYATQYGGEGEPIPATKISYDNTTSGLTADDIQEAVDEVAGSLNQLAENVDELYLNGYTVEEFASAEYTPVENDTYGKALDGIASVMNDVIAALEDDEMIVANNIVITNVATLVCRNQPHYNTDSNFNAVAFSLSAGDTSMVLYSAVLYGGAGNSFIDKVVLNSSGSAFENISNSSVTATNVIRLSYYKYKKIKSED